MEKIDGVCCKNCIECKYYKNREIDPFVCLSVNAFSCIERLEKRISELTTEGKDAFVSPNKELEE